MNSIFYSPYMLQLSKNKAAKPVFCGGNMQKYNDSELLKCLNKIKSSIDENTVPEFGNFAPIAVNTIFENDDSIVFQIKPSKVNSKKKELNVSFINAQTEELSTYLNVYDDKFELLSYIKSIDIKKLRQILDDFANNA